MFTGTTWHDALEAFDRYLDATYPSITFGAATYSASVLFDGVDDAHWCFEFKQWSEDEGIDLMALTGRWDMPIAIQGVLV